MSRRRIVALVAAGVLVVGAFGVGSRVVASRLMDRIKDRAATAPAGWERAPCPLDAEVHVCHRIPGTPQVAEAAAADWTATLEVGRPGFSDCDEKLPGTLCREWAARRGLPFPWGTASLGPEDPPGTSALSRTLPAAPNSVSDHEVRTMCRL